MRKVVEHSVGMGEDKVFTHELDDGSFCISFGGGGWMPGSYDSIETAVQGAYCCFKDESRFVNEVQIPVNHFDKGNRDITINDINNWNDNYENIHA